ncbi:uncharacterized protein [Triticum aestivum]|uniref:uncharacterized protein isoform X2 n=1 Tax=Triticum aestivum TaxID=4565 RepID=UPI001D00B0EE|nr:uncharacterized protein LOC123144294 isoform X2 [Triticum aestivum]
MAFSDFSGLTINFHKSTLVPVSVDPNTASAIAQILGCPVSSFPCTYLGLPLSLHKITHGMLLPVIHKVDRRLSGWLATFLSLGGRLTLINSVLAGIPSYFMSCFAWPMESLGKLECLLRAFFWQGKSKVKGGQCLVAWDTVSLPRINGGLGIRQLQAHNQAMMCKFVSKILQSSDIPCYKWFATHYCRAALPQGTSSRDTAIWKGFKDLIPLVINSSRCDLGSGTLVSFWKDQWLDVGRLCLMYPTLFSFASYPACSVHSQYVNGAWAIQLHPNLSQMASTELLALHELLSDVTPNLLNEDKRIPSLGSGQLSTRHFYSLLTFRGVLTTFEPWVWDSLIPLKHRIFLWLAFRGRLNTRDNMVKKGWSVVAPFAHCDACPAVESADHLLLRCASASVLWGKLVLDTLACSAPDILAFVEQAQHQLSFKRKWNVAFAACALTLWHARNDRVFNSKIAERLDAFQASGARSQNYLAMYSSIFGGITTDPSAMVIPIDDHMVHRGHGVFDTAAIMDGHLYELEQHIDRFLNSAQMAKIPLPFDRSTIQSVLIQTVCASKCSQGSLRYWLSAGPGDFQLSSSGCRNPALYAVVIESPSLPEPSGCKVITSSIPVKSPQFAVMKNVNYLPNALTKLEGEENGGFTGIWLDDEGFVAEGSNMNVGFVTLNKELLMPRFDKILSGCTAKRVLALAEQLVENGMLSGISSRNVSVQEGKEADEMMLIGSGILVKPVVQWDDQMIGSGLLQTPTSTKCRLLSMFLHR